VDPRDIPGRYDVDAPCAPSVNFALFIMGTEAVCFLSSWLEKAWPLFEEFLDCKIDRP
jgi:hypothetical protein